MLSNALLLDAKGKPIHQDHKVLSDDWDEIKDWSTKVYMPYDVSPTGRFYRPVSTMHSAKIGRITVTRFAYGIPVNIRDWSKDAGNAVVPTTIGGTARTVDRGSVGPVLASSTVARFRHFVTVLGLMPGSRLSCESEACDRCIAALTACVVVALP